MRQQNSISLIPKIIDEDTSDIFVEIVGQLKYADSIKENDIKIVDDKSKAHKIIVPEGMMSDIVKPLWDEKVKINGKKIRGKVILFDIQKAE